MQVLLTCTLPTPRGRASLPDNLPDGEQVDVATPFDDNGSTKPVCEECGGRYGHEWLCPIGIDLTARWASTPKQRKLYNKLLGDAAVDDVEWCEQAARQYATLYGDDHPAVQHWRLVAEEVRRMKTKETS